MKMTKEEIRILKSKHRLELVMQSSNVVFEVDVANSDLWHGKTDDGFAVTVNIKKQRYELSRPGMDIKAGDVIAWLQIRYSWDFEKAITYLQKRAPDPKQKTQPAKIAKHKEKQFPESDFVTISHVYKDPATGAESYGVKYNYEIMDDLQKRALDAAGDWVIKYFTKSIREISAIMKDYPHRFKPVIDFDIDKCARCETPFNWKSIGTFAYACEEEKYPDFDADCDDNEKKLNISVNMAEPIFCEIDFVICEKCARGEYATRYKALRLVWKSAWEREEAEQQRQRDHEAWIEAEREREKEREERMNSEAAYSA